MTKHTDTSRGTDSDSSAPNSPEMTRLSTEQAEERTAREGRLFYIQDSRSYCGNSAVWWRPNGQGYTSDLAQAWRVDSERAESICRCRKTDKMWPCDQIDAMAQRHFDSQNFPRVTELLLVPCTDEVASGVE